MRFWERLTRKYTPNTLTASLVLSSAYRNLFLSGNSDNNQRQMVLSDIAANCNWNQITLPETGEQRIWFNEGKRAAYALIFAHLSLSPEDILALENAARHEAMHIQNQTN
jgi:hypothetical protein